MGQLMAGGDLVERPDLGRDCGEVVYWGEGRGGCG